MKLKHIIFRPNMVPIMVARACLVCVCGGVLIASEPVVGQEASNQKSSDTNLVAQGTEKSATEDLPIEIVTHVDAMPPFTEKAMKLLKDYRQETLKDSGNKRIDILQQIGRPNHFSIVEEWVNQKAFNDHESAPHTRQFRTDMQDALGAPYDERPHHFIKP